MSAISATSRWYRQPIAWLGIAFLSASLLGCVWILVLASQYPDQAVPAGEQVFKVPATHEPKTQ